VPVPLIVVGGSLAGIHAGETRSAAEGVLGCGHLVSVVRHSDAKRLRTVTIERVHYLDAGLTVVYGRAGRSGTTRVMAVFTHSTRYHTASGLRVGSTLSQANRTPGITCTAQLGYEACQGGDGYEKPVTSFTVRNGHVVDVFMAAAAD
jgi:hypothetical protein